MKYVLDASVALKWVLDEPNVERALFLRKEYEALEVTELIAPDIFPVEIAHAISKGFRQGKFSGQEAQAHLGNIFTSMPKPSPYIALLPRAFEIAGQTITGVYDALYPALGERENASVVTADSRLAKLPFNVVEIDKLPYPPARSFRRAAAAQSRGERSEPSRRSFSRSTTIEAGTAIILAPPRAMEAVACRNGCSC